MPISKRQLKLAAFGTAAIAAILVWTFAVWSDEIAQWILEMSRKLEEFSVTLRGWLNFLDGVPLIFYSLAIFILPICFMPVTPIFVVAAARAAEESYMTVFLYCYLGIAANIIFSYFISRRFGSFMRGKFSARGINIPEIPKYEEYELIFLMRMIPGNPLAVQNYGLGIANVDFFRYLVVSLPVQFVQVAAYVYFGEAIFDGGMSKIMLAVSTLLVIAVIARMLNKRYGHKLHKKKNGISQEQ